MSNHDDDWVAPMYHPHKRTDEHGNQVPWPQPPKAPAFRQRLPSHRPLRISPYVDNGRDGLEVLARLAGGTSFKLPSAGRATRLSTLGTDDIAHALGFLRDPLEQRMVLAITCQTAAEWPAVQEAAYDRLTADLRGNLKTRHLLEDGKQFRVRLVLHEAFHDLALVRSRPTWEQGAKRVRMNRRDYQDLYCFVRAFLETVAGAGAHKACRVLFSSR